MTRFLTDCRVKNQQQQQKKQAWNSCFPVTLSFPQQTPLKAGASASSAIQFALHCRIVVFHHVCADIQRPLRDDP